MIKTKTKTKQQLIDDILFDYYRQDLQRMTKNDHLEFDQWLALGETNPHKMKALQRKWYERQR